MSVTRRRMLQGLGALPFAAIAPWLELYEPPTLTRGVVAPLMAGSVTNPTGTVSGNSLTGLQDAYTGNFGGLTCPAGATMAQWQMLTLLSNAADACTSGTPFQAGELTVRVVLLGTNALPDCAPVYPPAADLPLVFDIAVPAPALNPGTSDGAERYARVFFNKAKNNGQAGNDVEATSGTVTITRADSTQYEGSFNVSFPAGGSFSGAFTAPWCGTPPA